jgi:hypothetical protein
MLYEPGDIVKVTSGITVQHIQYISILEILVQKEINGRWVRRYRYYNMNTGDISSGLLMNSLPGTSLLNYELHWRASDKQKIDSCPTL